MKKFLRILTAVALLVVVTIAGSIAYIKLELPDVGPAPDIDVEGTAAQVERGRYLANAVAVCMDCHSTRDWSKFSGPITPGTEGKGGERFDQTMGFPGVYYSRNITPAGISRYTDGELYRLITTGVTKEGRAIFPVMPYPYYGAMDDSDVYAIIAYLRTLAPIENEVRDSESDFPMNIILNTIPHRGTPTNCPSPGDTLAYGGYLTNVAACQECHTQAVNGQIVSELSFGGGREFLFPDGSLVRSANLTPDDSTGIGRWTKAQFVARFKMYADSSAASRPVGPGDFNTIMPWTMYARMTEEDLGAIYEYLHTLKPISNHVVTYTPPVKE